MKNRFTSSQQIQTPTRHCHGLAGVILSCGIAGLGIGLTIPLISINLDNRGFCALTIGLNNAVYSIAILLAGPFYPSMIRRIGALRGLYSGTLICAVILAAFAITNSIWIWFLLRFLMGISSGLYWIISETWINATIEETSRGRAVGIYGTVFSLGIACGPLLLNIVGVDGMLPFIIAAAVTGASVIPLLRIQDTQVNTRAKKSNMPFTNIIRFAPLAIGAAFVSGYMNTTIFALFPVYGLAKGFRISDAVLLLSIFSIGSFLLQIIIGWLADITEKIVVFLMTSFFAVILIPFIPHILGHPFIIQPLVFLWGGAVDGLGTLGMIRLGEQFSVTDLPAATTISVMSYTLGMSVGPVISGGAMDLLGPDGLLSALGIVAVAFLGGTLQTYRHERKTIAD